MATHVMVEGYKVVFPDAEDVSTQKIQEVLQLRIRNPTEPFRILIPDPQNGCYVMPLLTFWEDDDEMEIVSVRCGETTKVGLHGTSVFHNSKDLREKYILSTTKEGGGWMVTLKKKPEVIGFDFMRVIHSEVDVVL